MLNSEILILAAVFAVIITISANLVRPFSTWALRIISFIL